MPSVSSKWLVETGWLAARLDEASVRILECGAGDGIRVVLYDRRTNMWAARVWWMLRAFGFDDAAVLNGRWRKWRRENRPVNEDFGERLVPGP